MPAMDDAIELIHLDAAMLVVRKPAGLLSVPGRGPENADCVAARVQREGLLNYLADNQNAWEMRADGCYERRLPAPGEAPFSAQLAMLDALNA